MSDPLYRKEILRLAADAVGAGRLAAPDASATVHNPICGDLVTVDLTLQNGRIAALGHETQACILAQASAAILGAHAAGLSRSELGALAAAVRAMLEGATVPEPGFDAYGAFDGVGTFESRKRVLLPIEAALAAFDILEQAHPPSSAGQR